MADASLVILLTAKDEASKILKGAGQEAEGLGSKLKGAAVALGTFAAGFASFRALEGAVDATKELGTEVRTLSRETGLGAEDASRFIFAIKELGLAPEDASRSLGILAKNLVNTRDTLSEGKDAASPFANSMKVLGVSFIQADGNVKPLNQVMLDLADRFKAMPDGAEKTARAIDIFGRSGKDMIPVLNLGSQGIKELAAEADKLGVTLTAENAENIRQYTRAQREFNEALLGLKVTIGTAIIPALTDFSHWFTAHQQDVRAFAQNSISAIGDFAEQFRRGFGVVKQGIEDVLNRKEAIIAAIVAIGAAFAWTNPVGAAFVGAGGLIALVGLFSESLDTAGTSALNLRLKIINMAEDGVKAVGELLKVMSLASQGPAGLAEAGIGKVLGKSVNAVNPFAPAIDALTGVSIKGLDSLLNKSGTQNQIAYNNSAIPQFLAGIDKYIKTFAGANTGGGNGPELPPFPQLGEQTKKLTDIFGEAGNALRGAIGTVASAISGLFADPTKERAGLNLAIDRSQLKFDQLTDRMQPSLDALSDFKESLQGTKDRLDAWGDSISERKTQLSDQSYNLDQKIKEIQAQPIISGAGSTNGQKADLSGQTAARDAQVKALENQKDAIEKQQRALDLEERARQRQIQALDKQSQAADRQTQAIQRQIELAGRDLARQERQAKLDDDRKRILQDSLTFARQDLLTNQQQQTLYEDLNQKIPAFTEEVKNSADALGLHLTPGFDALTAAISGPNAFNSAIDTATGLAWKFVDVLRVAADINAKPLRPINQTGGVGNLPYGPFQDQSFLWQATGGGGSN